MPRPRKLRFVQGRPIVSAFVPDIIPPWGREEVILPIEGLEAIRLSDFQGLDQEMAAKMMIEQGGNGNILNISSIGGISPDKGLGVYCISKAAINMLTRALALELGEYNIRVNAIAPGVVQTYFSQVLWSNEALMAQEMEHTPLKRIAQPEEVARIALTIVSEAAAYITGQVIVMDGGGTL